MDFSAKEIKLKDGRTCVLRPPTKEDAAALIEYLKATAGETPYLVSYPDEIGFTASEEEKILKERREDPRSVMMLAEVDGRLAGNGGFVGAGSRRKLRHRCEFCIALYRDFHRLGIGTALIVYLMELARQAGYEQMDLNVHEDNAAAIALYKKCGFIESGRLHNAVKLDDGSYRDYILMYKPLTE
ncbi:MAG: GNAT family N-acetyltransferase [Clostridia bacterium]|nr:GNAT family N-acetyltransferase [Clostridia bacterium]